MELCCLFEESGYCKYGDKCQFVYGVYEFCNLNCYFKYKIEFCCIFYIIGFCLYGFRCYFIYNDEERNQSVNKNYFVMMIIFIIVQ